MRDDRVNAFTVDVEDAVNQAMRNFFSTEMPPTDRVYTNTMRILDLLSEYGTLATFFVLGEVAETFPKLVREISERGHELGIHGYSHLRYHKISREKARNEIVRAVRIIEDISGKKVLGHRAPEFSINSRTRWVLEILHDEGIKYDSSIFPLNGNRYGWPGQDKNIDYIKLSDGREIIEAPLSILNFLSLEIPVCGGGYLRAMPYRFTEYAFRKISEIRPVITYLHPYEIDIPPFQQFYMNEVRNTTFRNRLVIKSYWYNRSTVIPKLNKILKIFRFTSLIDVINNKLRTNY